MENISENFNLIKFSVLLLLGSIILNFRNHSQLEWLFKSTVHIRQNSNFLVALFCIMLNYFSSLLVWKYDITFLFREFFTENLSKTLVSYSLYLVDSSCIPYLIISYAYLLWVMGHPCSFACSCALSPFLFPVENVDLICFTSCIFLLSIFI